MRVLAQHHVGDEQRLTRNEALVARHTALKLLGLLGAGLALRVLLHGRLQQPVLELGVGVPELRKVAHRLHAREALLEDVARALKVRETHVVVRERRPEAARLVAELGERGADERLDAHVAAVRETLRVRGGERRELQPQRVLALTLARLKRVVVDHAHQLTRRLLDLLHGHEVVNVVLDVRGLELEVAPVHAQGALRDAARLHRRQIGRPHALVLRDRQRAQRCEKGVVSD